MNYTEKYELRQYEGGRYTVLSTHHEQEIAIDEMESLAHYDSGTWRVVRVMEVTVASIAKA